MILDTNALSAWAEGLATVETSLASSQGLHPEFTPKARNTAGMFRKILLGSLRGDSCRVEVEGAGIHAFSGAPTPAVVPGQANAVQRTAAKLIIWNPAVPLELGIRNEKEKLACLTFIKDHNAWGWGRSGMEAS